jgi:hypothetical protein
MRVVSKLVSADVKIVAAQLSSRRLVVEGRVEELVTFQLELGREDLRPLARALSWAIRERLAEHVPGPLARALVRRGPTGAARRE